MNTIDIIGGGLSGLIAAHALPSSFVYEANKRGQMHNAVLRFRSEAVSQITGIPFKKVLVRKGIYAEGGWHAPTISIGNQYSQKVLGLVDGERSIWDIDPVYRWIAPHNFYDLMVDRLVIEGRISFETPASLVDVEQPTISTIPLPVAMAQLDIPNPGIEFDYSVIFTLKFKLSGFKNTYQTVYFPSARHGLYRASITDNWLIAEFVHTTAPVLPDHNGDMTAVTWQNELAQAFRFGPDDRYALANALADQEMGKDRIRRQQYGKIDPIASSTRQALLFHITAKHHIYSLGRFATWRNILLDDVVNDVEQIKAMMAHDDYQHKLERGKQ